MQMGKIQILNSLGLVEARQEIVLCKVGHACCSFGRDALAENEAGKVGEGALVRRTSDLVSVSSLVLLFLVARRGVGAGKVATAKS